MKNMLERKGVVYPPLILILKEGDTVKENKTMPVMINCTSCKKVFCITGNGTSGLLKHKEEFTSNGQQVFLTYYDCPDCGVRQFVQIDDRSSLQELERNKSEFIKLAVAKTKGKEITKKQSEKFKKARQHLSEYRMNLIKQFTGKSAIDKTGAVYVLRFNI